MKQLKHLRQTLWRALLCLTVAVTCLGGALAANFNKDATLYFKISNSGWKEASAWFVANFNNNNTFDGTRVKLDNVEGDYYSCTIPDDFSHVELLRMDPDLDINADAWDYSNNFSQSPNGNNCLELESTGWSNINLSWTTYNNGGGDVTTDLYIGGNFQNSDWTNLTKLTYADGTYADFEITTTGKNQQFRFYTSNINNINAMMGANGSTKQFTDDELKGTDTFTTTYQSNYPYQFKDAGTYIVKVTSYDSNTKVVKFTVRKKDGGEVDPPIVGDNPYNYYLYIRDNDWIPFVYADGVYSLDKSVQNKNFCIVALDKNKTPNSNNVSEQKIYSNNATLGAGSKDYPLTLNSTGDINNNQFWGGNVESSVFVLTLDANYLPTSVKITVPEKEYVPADDYYFIGDLNDWFSTEFSEIEGGATSMELFEAGQENWKFRKATASDLVDVKSDYLTGLESLEGWYVFDKFPKVDGKVTLSGQFQISSGGTHIWSGAEVFGLCYDNVALKDKNGNYNLNVAAAKNVLQTPITGDDIAGGNVFKSIHRRLNGDPNVSFANFHLDCNAVADAKVFFKPNFEGKAELVVTGTPKNYYVFYYAGENGHMPEGSDVTVNHEEDGVDKKITAKINSGKPNTNNYFLPGILYNVEVPSVDKEGNDVDHMNVGNGIEMTKIKDLANKYYYDGPEATEINKRVEDLMTTYGIDKEVAEGLVKGHLPNGRVCSDFSYLYITKLPNGFENPAGWKYNLKVNSEVYSPDNEKSVVITTNHIYYLKNIGGVAVHINDTGLMSKPELKDYESKYYYRVYYSASSAQAIASDESYSIHVVDHYANNVIGDGDKEIYNSKDTNKQRKKTLVDYNEAGNWTVSDADAYGWKELNPVAPETEKFTWHNDPENLDNFNGGREWHMHLVEKEPEMARLLIPDRYNMSYVQILSILTPKSAKKSAPRRAAAANTDVNLKKVLDEARNNGAIISYAPGSLDFDNDEYHHPLQGNHLFLELKAGQNVWTGIENIEDDVITDAEGDVNAAPVYYNLQGVRVAEPTKGIFIEVRGNKSRKVAF